MRHVQKGEIVSPPERPRIRINFIKVRQGKCSERLEGVVFQLAQLSSVISCS